MKKRIVSIVLVLCLTMSMFATVPVNAAEASSAEVSASNEYGLAENVQNGQILQCWNWSFDSIKNNMQKIAEQGFSAVQTSPIQTSKESTNEWYSTMKNNWWVYYQPVDWKIETNYQNALGTVTEFKAMCEEAHKYGVKVIVDAVLNHTGNNNGNNSVSTLVPSEIRDDVNCWHDISKNSWYASRWDITQFCMEGLPDLNTWNSKVQTKSIEFLKECVDAGADGFRFDGAKHIETPVDEGFSSEFWPNIINATTSYAQSTRGITPYYYGEVLDSTTGSDDGGNGQKVLNSYSSYMSVTLSDVSNTIREAVNGNNATTASRGDFYLKDGSQALGSKSVLWNESHDTYADGESSWISDTAMKKTWALVGSRNEACGMYMARPNSLDDKLGTGSVTAWGDTEVKAVNQFKNKYIGQSEYLSNSGSIAYNERGTTGAVLVNVNGTSAYVNVAAHTVSAGTYTDAITGNKFTVTNSTITGNIGSSGIAVITKDGSTPTVPEVTVDPNASATIYFDNDAYNWTNVYAYVYTDSSENAAWPGQQMTYDSSAGYYKLTVKGELTNGNVIFTESSTATTNRYPADQQPGLSLGGKDMMLVANNSWTDYVPKATVPEVTEDPNASATIYFDNDAYNWSDVYAYVYTDSTQNAAWPGQKMTYDSAEGYYKLTLTGGLANGNVIFTESSSATTNRYPADQQPGLSIGGKNMMLVANNSWTDYAPKEETDPETSVTLYFDNTSYNWSSVYAYAYYGSVQNAAWPGQQMTYDSSTGYYTLTLKGDLTNGSVIFTESSSATTNRYPADQEPGLPIGGKSMVFGESTSWAEYALATGSDLAVASAYTLDYDSNGGTGSMARSTASYNEETTISESTFKNEGRSHSGWTAHRSSDDRWLYKSKLGLLGWYEEDNQPSGWSKYVFENGEIIKNLSAVCNDIIKLFAQWDTNSYVIRYNPNGGSGYIAKKTVDYDASYTLPENTYTRTGYNFVCWVLYRTSDKTWLFTDSNGNTGWYKDGSQPTGWTKVKYDPGENVSKLLATDGDEAVFHPRWSLNPYKLTYHPNGGTGTMSATKTTYNKTVAISKNSFTNGTRTFIGWTAVRSSDGKKFYVSESGEKAWYTEGTQPSGWTKYVFLDCESIKNLTDAYNDIVRLYAQWSKNSYYIGYHPNLGSGYMAGSLVKYDAEYKLPECGYTRTGYTFSSWVLYNSNDKTWFYTDSNGSTDWYAEGAQPTGWKKVTYNPGQAVSKLTDVDGGRVVFYPRWTINSYKISFNSNSGTGTMSTITATYNKAVTLPKNTFTKSNSLFMGWTAYRVSDGTKFYVSTSGATGWYKEGSEPSGWTKYLFADGESVKNLSLVSKDTVKLYANWNQINYTIKYTPSDGTGTMENTSAVYGQAVTLRKNTFTYTGKVFTGWTARRDSDGKWLYRSPSTGACSWYLWDQQPSGWEIYKLTDGRNVSNLSKVDNDLVVLYAKWSAVKYTIKYTSGGGAGSMSNTTAEYGKAVALRKNEFTYSGKAFNGWTARRDSDGKWLYRSPSTGACSWYLWEQQPSGWEIYKLTDGRNVSNLSKVNNDLVVLYAKWYSGQYTIEYIPGDASGSMANTTATFDQEVTLRKNAFTYSGAIFKGWTVRRKSDSKWLYKNSKNALAWYTWGSQPSGWSTYMLSDGRRVSGLSSGNNDTIELYAKWNTNIHYIKYLDGGGSGSMSNSMVAIGEWATLKANTYTNGSKGFKGWTARRNSDGKWFYQNTNGSFGWYAWGSQPSGYSQYILADKRNVKDLTSTKGDTIELYAKWTDNAYTVKYTAGGGSGSMSSTIAAIGYTHTLSKNSFTNSGKRFVGWTVRRNSDGKWFYKNNDGSSSGWYAWGSQPSGWNQYYLDNGRQVKDLTTTKGDTIELYAKWGDIETIKSMSFNVRVKNANADASTRDPQNGVYPDYKSMVTQRILEYMPDTIGLQEVDTTWYKYLTSSSSGLMGTYGYVGHGRNSDKTGEGTPIMYNKNKFNLVASGTKWLTSNGKYGISAGESYPRIFTYALLERKTDKQKYMIVNTHLALGESGRIEQIGYLTDYIDNYKDKYPTILTGDMNTEMKETSVYNNLANVGLQNASFLASSNNDKSTATFTRYGQYSKILDYLFINSSKVTVSSYKVCDDKINGYDVSDHYPILVEYKAK